MIRNSACISSGTHEKNKLGRRTILSMNTSDWHKPSVGESHTLSCSS